jgi:hypothetical protein
MIDADGVPIKNGDIVGFSYGIPPIHVRGSVTGGGDNLILPTPGHKPPIVTLKQLKKCGIQFYKYKEPRT